MFKRAAIIAFLLTTATFSITNAADSGSTVSEKSKVVGNMSRGDRAQMEMEKRAYSKAYRQAYAKLTPEQRQKVVDLKHDLAENVKAQKEFFYSLPEDQRKLLAYPEENMSKIDKMRVNQGYLEKMRAFNAKRKVLMAQMPKELNIELSKEDEKSIERYRQTRK